MNLIGDKLLQRILIEIGNVEVSPLSKPQTCNVAVGADGNIKPMYVVFSKTAVMPDELHIRHGKKLVLRNIQWMVTEQPCSESLTDRAILERIGFNAREILGRAADLLGGEFDVADIGNSEDFNTRKLSRIIEYGVFHSNGVVDNHDTDNDV